MTGFEFTIPELLLPVQTARPVTVTAQQPPSRRIGARQVVLPVARHTVRPRPVVRAEVTR